MTTYSATLRIMGELQPEKISAALSLRPSMTHKRGDPRIGKGGRRYADYSEGLWALTADVDEDLPPGDHLGCILSLLEVRREPIDAIIRQGLRVDIYISVFGEQNGNLGFSLSSDVLARLVSFKGITLEFDIYD